MKDTKQRLFEVLNIIKPTNTSDYYRTFFPIFVDLKNIHL